MALSDILGTETGLHELHSTISSVKTALQLFSSTETCQHYLQRTANTVETVLSELLGTKTGLHELHSIVTRVKTASQILPSTETSLHELQRKRPTRLKWRYRTISAFKQPCTSFIAPSQEGKLLHRSFLALKHACMCFKGPPRLLKRCYLTFTALKQAWTSFIAPSQG